MQQSRRAGSNRRAGNRSSFVSNYAKLEDEKSGRCLEVRTDNQGIVIYTANWLHEIGRKNHTGIAFEAQELPCLSELNRKNTKWGEYMKEKQVSDFTLIFKKKISDIIWGKKEEKIEKKKIGGTMF